MLFICLFMALAFRRQDGGSAFSVDGYGAGRRDRLEIPHSLDIACLLDESGGAGLGAVNIQAHYPAGNCLEVRARYLGEGLLALEYIGISAPLFRVSDIMYADAKNLMTNSELLAKIDELFPEKKKTGSLAPLREERVVSPKVNG